jgi:Flp pilus assembly protein TadD
MPETSILQEIDWLSPSDFAERLRTLAAQPPSARRDADLAFLSMGAQRSDEATRYAESAFAADPSDPYAAYACGMTRVGKEDWERGLEALLKVPVDFERAGEVATLCGLALLELERFDEADRVCGLAGGVDDDTYATLCGIRAKAAAMQGKSELAVQLLDRALRYGPKLDWVRRMRAALPAQQGESAIVAVVI